MCIRDRSTTVHYSTLSCSSSTISNNISTPSTSVLSSENDSTPVGAIKIVIPVPDKRIVGAEKVAAEAVLKELGSQFKQIYNKDFTDVVPKIPGSNLQIRPTNSERKKKLRKLHKAVKSSIEKTIHSRDTNIVYGTRQSKAQYGTQRLSYHFESKEKAEIRTEKRKYFLDFHFKIMDKFFIIYNFLMENYIILD